VNPSQGSARLLLIEDNAGDARLLREMLREGSLGATKVSHVETMRDAETHLAATATDIILLDLGLPDTDGLTPVSRAQAAAPGVPIVVLTGTDDTDLALGALQEGAQDYLVKGQIDSRGIDRALRYAVERKALEEALFAEKENAQVTLHCIGDGVICAGEDGRITFLNPVAERMTGLSREQGLGAPLMDTVRMVDAATRSPLADQVGPALDRDRTLRLPDGCLLLGLNGSEMHVDGSVAPIHDRRGAVTGAVIVLRDLSESVAMAEQVARSADLEMAKEAAETADRAKSAFLSRMSHELRTPLNAILGFAQLLDTGTISGPDLAKVHHILKGGRHLLALIDEVLDISRIEADKLSLSCEAVSVLAVVTETTDLMKPIAAQEGISVFVQSCPDDVFVHADHQRLKQVVLNLLSNAVKYNHPEGSVSVSWAAMGPVIQLFVSDTGMGMSADRTASLYTPFERLGAEHTSVQGTGLGLALAKRLVEAMDGTIEVESTPDVGTRFTVNLPASAPPTARVVTDVRAPASGLVHTVLYVEDNLASLGLIEHMLADRTDVKILSAMQAGLGLQLARVHRPDVILIDLDLPDMSGEQLLDRLRSDPRTRDIPVAVLSADVSSPRRRRVLAGGAAAYLIKPLDLSEFDRMVSRLIGAVA